MGPATEVPLPPPPVPAAPLLPAAHVLVAAGPPPPALPQAPPPQRPPPVTAAVACRLARLSKQVRGSQTAMSKFVGHVQQQAALVNQQAFRVGDTIRLPRSLMLQGPTNFASATEVQHTGRRSLDLTHRGQLRMAWPDGAYGSLGSTAALLGCGKCTVSYVRKGAAHVVMSMQAAAVSMHIGEHMCVPVLIDKIKFDETKQTVTSAPTDNITNLINTSSTGSTDNAMDATDTATSTAPPKGPRRVRGAAAAILVQLRSLTTIKPNGQVFKCPLVVPVRILASKSGHVTLAGLEEHAPVKLLEMLKASKLLVLIRECDSAASNHFLLNMEYRQLQSLISQLNRGDCYTPVQLRSFCLIHQLHIVSSAMLACLADSGGSGTNHTISRLFSASMLMRVPGYFDKVTSTVCNIVTAQLVIRHGHPPQGLREAKIKILLALALDVADYEELLDTLNGDWRVHGRLEVYMPDVPDDRSQVIAHVTTVLLATVFRSLPDVPSPSRWARISYSTKFWAVGMMVHCVLVSVLFWCFDPAYIRTCLLPLHIARMVHESDDRAPDDATEYDDSNSWAKRVGSRVATMLRWLRLPTTAPYTITFSVILAAFNYPYHCLLHYSANRASASLSGTRPVPLLDFLFAPASPLTVTQQFASMLLGTPLADGPLCFASGHGCSWVAFRMLMSGVANSFVRIEHRLRSWPWKLFMVADSRHAMETRTAVALEFATAQSCCLAEFDAAPLQDFALRLAQRGQVSVTEAIMSGTFQHVLRVVASELDLSTSDVENCHAFCKRCSTDISSIELMSALYVLRSTHSMATSVNPPPPPTIPGATPAPRNHETGKWSGFHYFHYTRHREGLPATQLPRGCVV